MLEFQNVTLHRKKRKIIDNMNLQLEEGCIFGFVGTDQQAKSCILQIAVGSIKPSLGRIMLDGERMNGSNNNYLRVGYMPRKFEFYEHMTVEEYLEVFLALYKVNGRYRSRRVDEVLQFLEMDSYKQNFIMELPAELRTFLNLGKAILHDPAWLFLDEPFADLTSSYRKKMVECLGMLWEEGKSLIINTNIYPEITNFVTDIAVIEEGKIISKGSIQSVYKQALRESPIRLRIMDGMEQALQVLRENELVERVTVNGENVILLFSGGDLEEAQLLSQLVSAGALVHHYMRDPMDMNRFM